MLIKSSVQLFKSLFWGTVPLGEKYWLEHLILSLFHENSEGSCLIGDRHHMSQIEDLEFDVLELELF